MFFTTDGNETKRRRGLQARLLTGVAWAGLIGFGAATGMAQDSDGDTLSDFDETNTYLTDPFNSDTDGDGLRDDWEILGVPYTGFGGVQKRYQLPRPMSLSSNMARRKTILVETDSMGFPLRLNQAYRLVLVNAPVSNPDGTTGLDLVVITDEQAIPRTGWTYNPGAGINWPPEFAPFKMLHFGTSSERANADWYGAGGTSGPMREAKLKAFHYCVYADRLGNTTISGLAELPGNDFIVSLGGWFFGVPPLTASQLQWMIDTSNGTFLHELGHNLGLGHGGLTNVNYKPNYHSVMSYSWQVPRYIGGVSAGLLYLPIPPTNMQTLYAGSWSPWYSDTAFASVDENLLNENTTSMCGGCTGSHAGHVVPVGPWGPWGYGYLEFAAGTGVDWNRNGFPGEAPVTAGLNNPIPACVPTFCDPVSTCPLIDTCALNGFNDWNNLLYMGTGGNYSSGVSGAVVPTGPEMTFEDARMLSFVGGCGFEDPFDFYEEPADDLHERGGWKGWDNDPAFSAPVSQDVAYSLDTSVRIDGAADLVHEFCAGGTGAWSVSARQYIPSGFASGGAGQFAGSYFVMLNAYEDGVHDPAVDWSVQMQFDSNDGMLKVFHGDGINTINVPYATDRWVKIQVIVDIDDDWTRIYYDDELVTEYPWTGGVLGNGGGALDIAAVDLYANGSSPVYYDDFRIEEGCGALVDDDDGDGLDLLTEFRIPTNPCASDSDEDGLDDGTEIALGTEPLSPDSDLDGLTDGDEVNLFGTDPRNPDTDGNGTSDGDEDFDFDGLTNAEEIDTYGTDPLNPDTDGDGLPDGEEVNLFGSDPLNPDTDGDGHLDGFDNCPTVENPDQLDSDFDGIGDACECAGDVDGDFDVDITDLGILLSQFGWVGPGLQADLNGDGVVNITDLGEVLAAFGGGCL
jgi:hypothetical protein